MNNNQVSMLYDTLLSIPGMNEKVKIDLKISRSQVLLLAQVMQSGLKAENEAIAGLISAMPENGLAEMEALISECVEKAGLTALNGKLKPFNTAVNGK